MHVMSPSTKSEGIGHLADAAHDWLVLSAIGRNQSGAFADELVGMREISDFLDPVANFLAKASSHEPAMSTGSAHM